MIRQQPVPTWRPGREHTHQRALHDHLVRLSCRRQPRPVPRVPRSAYQDEFDAWRGRYSNPFRDLQDDGRTRNWDDDRRNGDLDAEGVAAEVVFPNTVPPFFPTGVVIAPAPTPEELPLRLAGIRAHNRWLADFVAAYPDRRCGQAQIFLNDVDEAIKDVRWCKAHGINGVLLPGVSPDTPWIEPLSSPVYDPLWAVCQELGMPITHHAGG